MIGVSALASPKADTFFSFPIFHFFLTQRRPEEIVSTEKKKVSDTLHESYQLTDRFTSKVSDTFFY